MMSLQRALRRDLSLDVPARRWLPRMFILVFRRL